jgi:hypothetical protein
MSHSAAKFQDRVVGFLRHGFSATHQLKNDRAVNM